MTTIKEVSTTNYDVSFAFSMVKNDFTDLCMGRFSIRLLDVTFYINDYRGSQEFRYTFEITYTEL